MTTTDIVSFSPDQLALIKSQIAPKATDDELALFSKVCERTGLDPFAKQIYCIHRNANEKDAKGNWQTVLRMTIQTSIDGFRVIAERSQRYEGQTAKQWCGPDGKWVDVWLKDTPPSAARVGVWKTGFREPLFATALWTEYCPRNKEKKLQATGQWVNMPALMLGKCAEALALRGAFPNDMSGLYTSDEMAQADQVETTSRGAKAPAAAKKAAAPKEVEAPKEPATPTEVDSKAKEPATVAEAAQAQAEVNRENQGKRGYPAPPAAATDEAEAAGEAENNDPVAMANETQMTALRDEVKQVKNADAHKGLVDAWTKASLPSIRDHAVVLTADQFEVAMRLALDATEKQAELQAPPTDEPLFGD